MQVQMCERCVMQVRLQKLKTALHVEWGELAQRLGVSRSLVDQARKNTRQFGPKTMRRLMDVERQAGILYRESTAATELYDHPNAGNEKIVKELSAPAYCVDRDAEIDAVLEALDALKARVERLKINRK